MLGEHWLFLVWRLCTRPNCCFPQSVKYMLEVSKVSILCGVIKWTGQRTLEHLQCTLQTMTSPGLWSLFTCQDNSGPRRSWVWRYCICSWFPQGLGGRSLLWVPLKLRTGGSIQLRNYYLLFMSCSFIHSTLWAPVIFPLYKVRGADSSLVSCLCIGCSSLEELI